MADSARDDILKAMTVNQAEPQMAQAKPEDGPMTFARWRQTVESIRRGSGLPIPSNNKLYEEWMKLQQKGT